MHPMFYTITRLCIQFYTITRFALKKNIMKSCYFGFKRLWHIECSARIFMILQTIRVILIPIKLDFFINLIFLSFTNEHCIKQ